MLFKSGILFFILFFGYEAYSQKNDTVYFLNGDRISGEIKSYQYGFLTFKTYGVSTVKIKYDKIATFYSNKNYEIIFANGSRLFGKFDTSLVARNVNIVITNDTLLTPISSIIQFAPIKNKFWRRIYGSADIGYSFTKSTTLSQLTFSSDLKYRDRKNFSNFKLNSINSDQNNEESTSKNDVTLAYYHQIKNNWNSLAVLSAEENSELGLDLRLQTSLGFGNEIIHTNLNNLFVALGVVFNREWSKGEEAARDNIDGMAYATYRMFRFKDPSVDITSSVVAYPSFTVTNRWRVNYDLKVKVEVISDLYFSLSYYYNYDTRPPSADAEKFDYGIVSSVGYTF